MALGKGLGALISPTTRRSIKKGALSETNSRSEGIWNILLSSIRPNPKQPRRYFGAKELDELASSIKEHGVLQPILVSELIDGGYEIISGERRWRASQLAGLSQIPALVKKVDDVKKLEISLIENIQREDLDPLEEAFAYKRLMDEFGLTQQEIADKVGKARPTIANMIRLLDLPEEVKEALRDKKITHTQAKTLLGLKTDRERLEMYRSMLGQKISSADLERVISRKNFGSKSKGPSRNPNIVYLEDELRSSLGTKIKITESQKGRGRVVIDYYSEEELTRLADKLRG